MRREAEDLDALFDLQRKILDNAATMVKPGGTLVYCTCTTEPEENLGVIRSFLELHPDFSIDPASQFVDSRLVHPEGFVETFPHRHQMDGSFGIRLKKGTS